jgi:hypothetical protein
VNSHHFPDAPPPLDEPRLLELRDDERVLLEDERLLDQLERLPLSSL